jgi:hypothetical protein
LDRLQVVPGTALSTSIRSTLPHAPLHSVAIPLPALLCSACSGRVVAPLSCEAPGCLSSECRNLQSTGRVKALVGGVTRPSWPGVPTSCTQLDLVSLQPLFSLFGNLAANHGNSFLAPFLRCPVARQGIDRFRSSDIGPPVNIWPLSDNDWTTHPHPSSHPLATHGIPAS